MRIATWNVNGLNARMEYVLQWLLERQPDIVGLQELKMPDDRFPHEVFAAAGYTALVHGQKSWNGVAVLSRTPMQAVTVGLAGQEDFGSRLLTARHDNLEFTTVYCPNGKDLDHADYPAKLGWFDSLAQFWSSANRDAAVLCGDFNICPQPLDTWAPDRGETDIFHTEAERARMRALFDAGLVDLYRARNPDKQAFSWWDYRGGSFHRNHGLRIDFILATPAVVARTKDVVIDRDFRKKRGELTASDHAPVYADLE